MQPDLMSLEEGDLTHVATINPAPAAWVGRWLSSKRLSNHSMQRKVAAAPAACCYRLVSQCKHLVISSAVTARAAVAAAAGAQTATATAAGNHLSRATCFWRLTTTAVVA